MQSGEIDNTAVKSESKVVFLWKKYKRTMAVAASIAGMFLTTECVITDKKEDNPAPQMPAGGMGGMGGMM